jgi:hypothetical protein
MSPETEITKSVNARSTMIFSACSLLSLLLFSYSDAFVLRVQPLNFQALRTAVHAANIDIEAASTKLLWEVLEERHAQPVLNLSQREVSPETDDAIVETSDWDQGQRWSETTEGLQALEISPHLLLDQCPQLYRLESSQVLETAAWLIQEGFGATYVISEPRVLSYKCCDAEYGLEFLQQMLMSTSFAPAFLAPLLLSGIEGGLQERAIQEALGAAGDATYNANQRIAGDAAATLKAFKQKRQGL